MSTPVKPVPEGFHTITPHLIVRGGEAAIAFYKKAFGAKEHHRSAGPGGKLMHAQLEIGSSKLFLADEFPEMGALSPLSRGGSSVTLSLYLPDADAVFNQAVAAGATVKMPMTDMFWGDRYGKLTDPFGHDWALCKHIEDVAPQEMERRSREAFAAMGKGPG
jgi:uncharacterized glyoxalase superfamily protein PhnB